MISYLQSHEKVIHIWNSGLDSVLLIRNTDGVIVYVSSISESMTNGCARVTSSSRHTVVLQEEGYRDTDRRDDIRRNFGLGIGGTFVHAAMMRPVHSRVQLHVRFPLSIPGSDLQGRRGSTTFHWMLFVDGRWHSRASRTRKRTSPIARRRSKGTSTSELGPCILDPHLKDGRKSRSRSK